MIGLVTEYYTSHSYAPVREVRCSGLTAHHSLRSDLMCNCVFPGVPLFGLHEDELSPIRVSNRKDSSPQGIRFDKTLFVFCQFPCFCSLSLKCASMHASPVSPAIFVKAFRPGRRSSLFGFRVVCWRLSVCCPAPSVKFWRPSSSLAAFSMVSGPARCLSLEKSQVMSVFLVFFVSSENSPKVVRISFCWFSSLPACLRSRNDGSRASSPRPVHSFSSAAIEIHS